MTDLSALRSASDRAHEAFLAACRRHYRDQWEAYRAMERGDAVPEEVPAAHDAWMTALHRFYLARDGERGFLGGRGLMNRNHENVTAA